MRLALPAAASLFAAGLCSGLSSRGGEAPLGLLVEEPGGEMNLTGSEPGFGAVGARFTLVEFVDFECPHCARMAPALHEFAAQNPDVRLIHRNYPLSSDCNANMQAPMHQHVCDAVVAAACAGEQGRFWEMQAAMFDHYTALTAPELDAYGADVGLDAAAFTACRARTQAKDVAAADVAAGASLQLAGTPAIYLHGAYGDRWVLLDMGPGDVGQLGELLGLARAGKALPEVKPQPAPEPAP